MNSKHRKIRTKCLFYTFKYWCFLFLSPSFLLSLSFPLFSPPMSFSLPLILIPSLSFFSSLSLSFPPSFSTPHSFPLSFSLPLSLPYSVPLWWTFVLYWWKLWSESANPWPLHMRTRIHFKQMWRCYTDTRIIRKKCMYLTDETKYYVISLKWISKAFSSNRAMNELKIVLNVRRCSRGRRIYWRHIIWRYTNLLHQTSHLKVMSNNNNNNSKWPELNKFTP